jgi:hypothetical protein
MLDNPEQPIRPEDAASAARDIVSKLVTRWREGGLPLIEALIDAGLEHITNERGPTAAVSVLQQLIRRIQDRILAERSDKLRVTRGGDSLTVNPDAMLGPVVLTFAVAASNAM